MYNELTFTLAEFVRVLIAICTAIITISGATAVIVKMANAIKKPNKEQNERLESLEHIVKKHDEWFGSDKKRFESLEDGNRVTQQALLALLDHGIDGNNVKQMSEAKEALQKHLIDK